MGGRSRSFAPPDPRGDPPADPPSGAGWPRLFQPGGHELAPAFTLRSSRCALNPPNAELHVWPRTTTSRFVSPTF